MGYPNLAEMNIQHYVDAITEQGGSEIKNHIQGSNDGEIKEVFVNPSVEDPSMVSKFCSHLDITPNVEKMEKKYAELKHFHYPIDAMIHLIPYQRLSRTKYHTNLVSRINGAAADLGFGKNDKGEYILPARKTITHFINDRLGNDGLKEIQESFITR